jgi:hypothetical protein
MYLVPSSQPSRFRIVGKMINPFSRPLKELDELIGPMIRKRLKQEETLGPTWQDRPVR